MSDLEGTPDRPDRHEWAAATAISLLCFAAACIVLILGIKKSVALATTPFEVLLGVLVSGALAVNLTTMGLVMQCRGKVPAS